MSVPYRSILIICHANTSRSVIAEALLRRMLERRALGGEIRVESAGVAAYARDGALVSLDARFVLRDEGIEISSDHVATDLKANPHLLDAADLVLAMTREQIRMLHAAFPRAAEKEVYTLRQFAGEEGDIEDPAGQDENVFAACRDIIKDCLERAFERIVPRDEGRGTRDE
jgi:protein-tyrosine-phosphatase